MPISSISGAWRAATTFKDDGPRDGQDSAPGSAPSPDGRICLGDYVQARRLAGPFFAIEADRCTPALKDRVDIVAESPAPRAFSPHASNADVGSHPHWQALA